MGWWPVGGCEVVVLGSGFVSGECRENLGLMRWLTLGMTGWLGCERS
jgi:hypothetical protein